MQVPPTDMDVDMDIGQRKAPGSAKFCASELLPPLAPVCSPVQLLVWGGAWEGPAARAFRRSAVWPDCARHAEAEIKTTTTATAMARIAHSITRGNYTLICRALSKGRLQLQVI